jgi:surface antigen
MTAVRLIQCSIPRAAAVLALAFAGTSCSMSYQLDSLLGSSSPKVSSQPTGSIPAIEGQRQSGPSPEADVALRAAARTMLTKNEPGTSQSWENPVTGARGTITPIATAFVQSGRTCRNFLASYIRAGAEAWLQGEACQASEGEWEVQSLKPWTRS